jgi:anti-sigma regulatory factor (Ser/Thr protein kinase)
MESLTVPGILDSLDAIAKYVIAVAAAAGLDKKASYKLRLAVDEIATNIIVHGYQEAGREGLLDLQADINEHALTILVEDTGLAFDPSEKVFLEEGALDQPLEVRPMGGLGIYLAFQGVDKFVYEKAGTRNRNIFVVNRIRV